MKCAEERGIVIIDGYVSSPRWAEMIEEHKDFHSVIFVHFDFTLDEILERLAKRRNETVEALRVARDGKLLDNVSRGVSRPIQLLKHFQEKFTGNFHYININFEDSTDMIVTLINKVVENIEAGYYDD